MNEMAYFLKSTGDHTDRTAEIEAMLNIHGVCCLDSGIFTVRGVNMPPHSTIYGQNEATRVILDPTVTEGFAICLESFCTLRDLTVLGTEGESAIPADETVGTRHGVLLEGTATTKDWMGPDLKLNGILHGLQIRGFSGGGLTCRDTGYYIRASLTASDCHILHCGAGINISHYSEYHKFTNMHCTENGIGCVNNGGNNVFVGCAFDGNRLGFLIDNSQGQTPNDAHGSMVGCTVNHTDNNKGVGIKLLGVKNGYVFSGCQMFFSQIVLENSTGIQFTGMNIGRGMQVQVKGGGLMMFTDCVCLGDITFTVTDNDAVRVKNCFYKDGREVVI
jgi:hypothetical protein